MTFEEWLDDFKNEDYEGAYISEDIGWTDDALQRAYQAGMLAAADIAGYDLTRLAGRIAAEIRKEANKIDI